MTKSHHPRRRWATALIATALTAPLLLGGATAAWAAVEPAAHPAADVPDLAEIAGDPPVGDTEADRPETAADTAPPAGLAPGDDENPQSPLNFSVSTPDLPDFATWYDAPINVVATASSRIGADVLIEWSTTGAQNGSGTSSNGRISLPITATGVTVVTVSAVDSEGNSGGPVSRTIRIDPTPPVVTIISPTIGAVHAGEPFVVEYTCEDPESGVRLCDMTLDGIQVKSGDTFTPTRTGTHYIQPHAWNHAYAYTSVTQLVMVVEEDVTPPDFTMSTDPAAVWHRGPVDVILTAWEPVGDAGVRSVEYRPVVDGVPGTWVTVAGRTTTVVAAREGANVFEARATDWFGNVSPSRTYTFRVDSTAPGVEVNLPVDGLLVEPGAELALEYSCTDTLSGVAECDGPVEDGELLDTSEEGTFEVVVRAVDRAGNETRVVRHYTVAEPDRVDPTIDFGVVSPDHGDWYHTAPDVTVYGQDATGIRVIAWELVHPDGQTEIGSSEGVSSIFLPASYFGEGVSTLRVTAVDLAGNEAEREFVLRVDGTAPTVTITAPGNAPALRAAVDEFPQGSTVPFTFDCADAVSGVASCESSVGATLPTGSLGTFTATVTVVDRAGHRTVEELEYTVVAADEPQPGSGSGSGSGTGGGTAGGGVPALASTGSEATVATILLALGLVAVGAIAAGSALMIRRGR